MYDEDFVKEMMENNNEDLDPAEEGHLALYLEELSELPVYEGDELRVLKMNVLAGRNDAKRTLTEHYMHHVVEVARLYFYQGIKLSELISEGNIALWNCVKNLNGSTGIDEIDQVVTERIMEAMEVFAASVKEDKEQVEYKPTEFVEPDDLLENVSNQKMVYGKASKKSE